MTTTLVAYLIEQLQSAFEGSESHSLLVNLRAVPVGAWEWWPPGAKRSIRAIVEHVGWAKFMYEDYAFGAAALAGDDPLVLGTGRVDSLEGAVDWLRAAQERLVLSVGRLDDADLATLRPTNWGEPRPTRWIIETMIEHDLYHAGEVNHIRALYESNDAWQYDI